VATVTTITLTMSRFAELREVPREGRVDEVLRLSGPAGRLLVVGSCR
jgi:hypothetical protein